MHRQFDRIRSTRSIHLIDIENLCGKSRLTIPLARFVWGMYLELIDVGPEDHVVVASSHVNLFAADEAIAGARQLVRSGRDGADIELAKVIVYEQIHERFGHVYLGSGDGGLAPFAHDLALRGMRVTSVSRMRSTSIRMRMAASDSIYIDGARNSSRRTA